MALTLKPNGSRPEDLDAGPRYPIADTGELPELVTAISKGPRSALDAIEHGMGRLRDLISERDEWLIAAIDQHKDFSARVVAGGELMAGALEEMQGLFERAMRPTPASSDAASEAPTLTH